MWNRRNPVGRDVQRRPEEPGSILLLRAGDSRVRREVFAQPQSRDVPGSLSTIDDDAASQRFPLKCVS